MNAEKYGLDRIYFGGCFIRGMSLFDLMYWILDSTYAYRSCGNSRHAFLCHTVLEQGYKACSVLQTRRFLVSLAMASSWPQCLLRAEVRLGLGSRTLVLMSAILNCPRPLPHPTIYPNFIGRFRILWAVTMRRPCPLALSQD